VPAVPDVAANPKQAFIVDIERRHGKGLRRFLANRLRLGTADVSDLVQEVFLRLLRVDHHETIRNSEAYVYTIASHVLHQRALRDSAAPQEVDITALTDEIATAPERDPPNQAEVGQRLNSLQSALQQLTPKARAVLLLHRYDGYSLEEIGGKLGISRAMAAKYLSKALIHCRQRLGSVE
jgi:RNA polymerase sigma factor (sigma-70 family)